MFRIIRASELKCMKVDASVDEYAIKSLTEQRNQALKQLDLCQQSQAALLHKLKQVQKTSKSRMAKINRLKNYIEKLKETH